jgi:predicted ATPase
LKRVFPPLYQIDFERTWSSELQKYDNENGDIRICLIQHASKPRQLWNLPADSLSAGTLRALGILAGLFQPIETGSPCLIGIEEPENSLHLAALGVLLEAFKEASQHRQVCIACHSTDVLGAASISDGSIFAVENREDETYIFAVDQSNQTALRESLCRSDYSFPFSTFVPSEDDLRVFDDVKK